MYIKVSIIVLLFTLTLTLRSPEMLAPANIPVAAGKNIANTEKNDSPPVNCGPILLTNTLPVKKII